MILNRRTQQRTQLLHVFSFVPLSKPRPRTSRLLRTGCTFAGVAHTSFPGVKRQGEEESAVIVQHEARDLWSSQSSFGKNEQLSAHLHHEPAPFSLSLPSSHTSFSPPSLSPFSICTLPLFFCCWLSFCSHCFFFNRLTLLHLIFSFPPSLSLSLSLNASHPTVSILLNFYI